jgi:CPA1 family monovalent cation:H+ antiporter
MSREAVFILMFVVAMTVAIGARRLRLPYTVALVLAGLLLGAVQLFPPPELTKTLLFSVFLPGLVFEAALHIDFNELWRNRVTVTSLAIPGVIASMALIVLVLTPVASALHFARDFTWQHALVFGALISATDPIAVIGIFRGLGVPRRLAVLLDGESLLNDGTGIVFFTLSLALVSGGAVTGGALASQFIETVGMGLVVGIAGGMVASFLIRQIDDPMIEITLTTIAAYGTFVAAEQLQYSGVIATVSAGVVCGSYGARTGMSPSTRVAVESFWEYVAFASNSIVFLLIGLEVHIHSMFSSWLPILVAYAVVTAGRALVIFSGWAVFGLTRERFPWRWGLVLTWGGLRGALPMVLVLSLPAGFPFRDLLVSMTFGVVIISILVHGLTMSPLLRHLGIVSRGPDVTAHEVQRGRMLAADAAMAEIDRIDRLRMADPELVSDLRDQYRQTMEEARSKMADHDESYERIRAGERYRALRELLLVEKNAVNSAYRERSIGARAQERLLADIDARLLRLESDEKEE